MEDIKSRLKKIAEYKGLSIRAFEEKCGLSRGNISNVAQGGAVGSDKLAKIFDTNSDINPVWIVTGRGEMLSETGGGEGGGAARETDMERRLLEMLQAKDTTILDQAKEIGRLEQRITELEQRLGKTVGDACTGGTANVG